MTFHNTVNAIQPELFEYQAKAQTQEDEIAAFFRLWRRGWSPSEVWTHLFSSRAPLTSVRRAISNLTAKGVLERTETKRQGVYGRLEYVWKLAGRGT